MRNKKIINRFLKMLLICNLISLMLVFPHAISYADATTFRVTNIYISRQYDNGQNIDKETITIEGSGLTDAKVFLVYSLGMYELKSPSLADDGFLLYELSATEMQYVDKKIRINGVNIDIQSINPTPKLTKVQPSVNVTAATLDIEGNNLTDINTIPGIDFSYRKPIEDDTWFKVPGAQFTSNIVTLTNIAQGSLGLKDIQIAQDFDTAPISFPISPAGITTTAVNVSITDIYKEQFRLVKDLNITNLQMFPNRGLPGSTVSFQADAGTLQKYDVFFMPEDETLYDSKYLGLDPTYTEAKFNSNNMDLLTVKVPALPTGNYKVVLTNYLNGQDPNPNVKSEYIIPDLFSIDSAENIAVVDNIQDADGDNTGPDTGSEAKVTGTNLGTLNIKNLNTTATAIDSISSDYKTLIRTYGDGSSTIATYGASSIGKIEKKITVNIGTDANFLAGSMFTAKNDILNVQIPAVDAATYPSVPVTVRTETILHPIPAGTSIRFTEIAKSNVNYNFVTSKIIPDITSVSPDKIQITSSNRVDNDVVLAIKGTNFFIQKVNGDWIYPTVTIGSLAPITGNAGDNADFSKMVVLNSAGDILDGSTDMDMGTTIILTIPENSLASVGKASITVTNSIRNLGTAGASDIMADAVEFVVPSADKIPKIDYLSPDVVTTKGGQVEIYGNTFLPGVRVFLNGIEVTGVTLQEDRKKITFNAPAGREGTVTVQVMNPEGGSAFASLDYVLAYVQPLIDDFSPKKGTAGNLVIIEGSNFLKQLPASNLTDTEIYKLIGTRVQLNGKDINDYNTASGNSAFSLLDYPVTENLFNISGSKINVASFSDAIVLMDSNHKYYVLSTDDNGNPVILGPQGEQSNYTIKSDSGNIVAENILDDFVVTESLSNGQHLITLSGNSTVAFSVVTPYVFNSQTLELTGKRTSITSGKQIYFIVPPLIVSGLYDLSVINYETSKDTASEQFEYSVTATNPPVITSITPSTGDVLGGYYINITGQNFNTNTTDTSNDGTRVYFDGVEMTVATNSYSVVDSQTIVFKVPPVSLESGVKEKPVPIVVMNNNGAAASRDPGFTYIMPNSRPKINKLTAYPPISGEELINPANILAAGGQLVELFGDNFYTNSINPKIYFNHTEITDNKYSDPTIMLTTSAITPGDLEIYVINGDNGMSNIWTATDAKAMKPSNIKISPPDADISGIDPATSKPIYATVTGENISAKNVDLQFGAMETASLIKPSDGTTSMYLPSPTAISFMTVTGSGLGVAGSAGTISMSYSDKGKSYSLKITNANSLTWPYPVYLSDFVNDTDGTKHTGYEKMYLAIDDGKLSLSRGYAPEIIYNKDLLGTVSLSVKTPSYYQKGIVDVLLTNNDDGSTASFTGFEYTAATSKPKITNVKKDGENPEPVTVNGSTYNIVLLPLSGGNTVTIEGEGFESGATVEIPDLKTAFSPTLTYNLATVPQTISFVMPAIAASDFSNPTSSYHEICVVNTDKARAWSFKDNAKKIYLQFFDGGDAPVITSISPSFGSIEGGTEVTITGTNFLEESGDTPTVYLDGSLLSSDLVEYVDTTKMVIITPVHTAGAVDIYVKNPGDYGKASNHMTFTYLSNPEIDNIVSATDSNLRVTEIAAAGGENIKILGSSFAQGAKVIFVPVLTKVVETSTATGLIYINGVAYTYEGTEGTVTEVSTDGSYIIVTTPAGEVGTKGLLVINPDSAATEIYEDIKYVKEKPTTPTNVTAELIDDMFVRIEWDYIENATRYDVYVLKKYNGDDSYNSEEFIGSTTYNFYVFTDLEPNTKYKFVVKLVGKFTDSPPSAESNEVGPTGSTVGIPDTDNEPGEDTTFDSLGTSAIVVIGTNDYSDNGRIIIDLTSGRLAGSKTVKVIMPAKVITAGDAENIDIVSSGYTLSFNPSIFNVGKLQELSSNKNSGIELFIEPYNSNYNSGNYFSLSKPYLISARTYYENEYSGIGKTRGGMLLSLNYERGFISMRNLNKVHMIYFPSGSYDLQIIGQEAVDSLNSSITYNIDKLGAYFVTGSQR